VFARYGFSPADDSSFANQIFDPAAVDDFYAAPDPVNTMIMGYHANTGNSVVHPDLITELGRPSGAEWRLGVPSVLTRRAVRRGRPPGSARAAPS
jgi:L-ornithine N5-oxygenase